jgi:hypothetical protein
MLSVAGWLTGASARPTADAIWDAERGLLTADLGGGVIKQRIARTGQGKSAGFRTLIALKRGLWMDRDRKAADLGKQVGATAC